jgi:integrase
MGMQQLDLIMEVGTLRGALDHLISNALECEYWTRQMHANHRRYLLEWFGDGPLSEVTYPRIREYVASEKRRGRAVETIRKRLSTLHMALEEAVRMDWIGKVPPWPVLKSDSRKMSDYWTVQQWEQAHLGCEDEDLQTFIAIGFWCGSHTSDIYRLRWADLDFTANTWTRRNTKSKATPVPLPIPNRLRALLWDRAELLQPHKRDLVVGRNMGHPNRAIKELARRCDIPEIRPIGLRHSCTTHLKDQGCDDFFRSFWLGHSSPVVTVGTYTHCTPRQIAEGAAKANAK